MWIFHIIIAIFTLLVIFWLYRYKNHLEAGMKIRTGDLEKEIAERKHIEEALRKSKEAAEAANQAKSMFLANMSHELRTPLNAIIGFTEIMEQNAALTETQKNHLEIIGRSGAHLMSLINDILDMSKIEAGFASLETNDFDLHCALANIRELVAMRAAAKGLSLTLEMAPGVPRRILTDERKLRQVLMNLTGNAVKFTQQGSITIRVHPPFFKEQPEFSLRIDIEDTGAGIAPDELDTLFEPFVQTRDGRKAEEGTGLGLAISRELALLMGGDICVESRVGEGSVFIFEFSAMLSDKDASFFEQPPVKCETTDTAAGNHHHKHGKAQDEVVIPFDITDELEYAARMGDVDEMDRIIAGIGEHNPDSAAFLNALTAKYQFDKILDLIEKSRENPA